VASRTSTGQRCGGLFVEAASSLSTPDELALGCESPEKLARLRRCDGAEFGSLRPSDPMARLDVGEHHLLLLERLDATDPDVAGGGFQSAVHGSGEMPCPALAFPACLDPPALHHSDQVVAGLGLRPLQHVNELSRGRTPLADQFGQNLQLGHRQRASPWRSCSRTHRVSDRFAGPPGSTATTCASVLRP
jgi:hypothetical protein